MMLFGKKKKLVSKYVVFFHSHNVIRTTYYAFGLPVWLSEKPEHYWDGAKFVKRTIDQE